MPDAAGPTIREYTDALRRRWWVAVLVAAAVFLVGAVPTVLEDATYSSGIQVRDSYRPRAPVDDDEVPQEELLELGSDITTLLTNRMRDAVVERLGPDAEPFGAVRASLVGFSTVISIRVEAGSPEAAAAAAEAYAAEFVEQRTARAVTPYVEQAAVLAERAAAAEAELADLDERLLDPSLDEVTRTTLRSQRSTTASDLRDLERRADDAALEAELRGSGIEIISDATRSGNPIAPQRRRAVTVSAAVAVLAGLAAAVVLDLVLRARARD